MNKIVFGVLLALSAPGALLRAAEGGIDERLRKIEDSRDRDETWQALTDADRLAAVPGLTVPQRAEARLQAGEVRVLVGDFAGAAKDFAGVLEARPDDPDVLLMLAEAKRDRPDEALVFAERAAQAAGGSIAGRAKAHRLAGELKTDLGDFSGAEKSLKSALALAPDDLDVLFALVQHKRDSRPDAAAYASRAESAAAKSPLWRRPAAYRLCARARLDIDDVGRGFENLRRALELNPEDLDALGAVVRIKDRLSAKDLAGIRRGRRPSRTDSEARPRSEPALRRALERDPNDLEALRMLTVLARDQGKAGEAAAHASRFMRAVAKTPVWQQAEAYRLLAGLWLALGDEARAEASLNRAKLAQADSLETEQALFRLKSAERDPESFASACLYIYCTAADMRLKLQDPAGAETLLTEGLKLKPDHAWALHLLSSLKKSSR